MPICVDLFLAGENFTVAILLRPYEMTIFWWVSRVRDSAVKTHGFGIVESTRGALGHWIEIKDKKIAAGAKFFQTQACYDPKSFEKLIKCVEKFKVPVMVGVIPLKNAGSARYMNAHVAGVRVPDELIDIMAKASKEDRKKVGIEMAATLIKQMKGMCQGVHIMAVAWEKKVPEIMALAGL